MPRNLKSLNLQLISTGLVAAAAIAGHDGSIWAKSGSFNCSPDEVALMMPMCHVMMLMCYI